MHPFSVMLRSWNMLITGKIAITTELLISRRDTKSHDDVEGLSSCQGRPFFWAIFGLTENWDYIGGIEIPWKDSHLFWMKLISATNRGSCHGHMGHCMYKAIYWIESNNRKKEPKDAEAFSSMETGLINFIVYFYGTAHPKGHPSWWEISDFIESSSPGWLTTKMRESIFSAMGEVRPHGWNRRNKVSCKAFP